MQLFWRRVFGHEEELETRLEGLGQNEINQLTVGRIPCQGGSAGTGGGGRARSFILKRRGKPFSISCRDLGKTVYG